MKQVFFLVTLLTLFAAAPQSARAFQDSPSSETQTHKLPTPEEVVSMLDRKLSFSDDQKAKITPIIADRQQRLREVAADQSGRRFQKARKMKSIYEDNDKKIKAVLTDDQKKKYGEIEQQMREQIKERRQESKNNSSE